MTNKINQKTKEFFLVQRALAGDQRAFTMLYNKYYPILLYKMQQIAKDSSMAEDMTMEAFEKAFSILETYSPEYTFGTWLVRIGQNMGVDKLRKENKNGVLYIIDKTNEENDSTPYQVKDEGYDPYEDIMYQQRCNFLKKCLGKLPDLQRKCLELKYFEGFSIDEIAEELEFPGGTIKSTLHRAKNNLKKYAKTYLSKEMDI